MALSDTQSLILTQASEHAEGLAVLPSNLPSAARGAVAKALLTKGLLEPVEAAELDPAFAWKVDGESVLLRITDAGRSAIATPVEESVAPEPTAPEETAAVGPVPATEPADVPTGPTAAESDTAADTAPVAEHRRPGLREAATSLIACWNTTTGRDELAAAIAHLRAALPAQAGNTAGPRPRRTDTKQATVLALLRRSEGASRPQMVEATGWAPHTVRGFLAGLAKRGIAVTVLERVRQVGTGKESAKGSYTIYRAEGG